MTTFTIGDRVRLKLAAARKLQETYGKNNPMFQNLIGMVGKLEPAATHEMDWQFVAVRRRFGVHEHEIERVDILTQD